MIGMDNDPATFGRPKASTANIYLNSFMVQELRCMAKTAERFGNTEAQRHYLDKAEKLICAVQSECWDKRDKFFYSVDVDICTRKFDWFHQGLGVFWKTLPIKIRVWSGFIPVSYTHLDVYKRQGKLSERKKVCTSSGECFSGGMRTPVPADYGGDYP